MKNVFQDLQGFLGRRRVGGLALGLALLTPSAFAQLYSENFDSGTAAGWIQQSGTWGFSGTTDKTYDSTIDGGGPEISYYNNASWDTGYTYSATVTKWGAGYGNQVGLVYYYKDASNYYEFQIGGDLDPGHGNTNLHLYEHIAGVTTEVADTTLSVGATAAVTIARSGNVTTIKIGATPVFTRTQTALTGGGKIGVADRWAKGKWNNVVVTDTAAPTVSISAPPDSSTQSGTINVSANASDNIGVAGVKFFVDTSTLIGTEDTSPPFSVSWNTSGVSNAQHVLTAQARDAAGNSTLSTGVLVTIDNGVTSPWVQEDVGNVGSSTGSASYTGGVYSVTGAGADIYGTADAFHFVSQPVSNDYTIVARVATQQNTNAWAKAGVMFRQTITGTNAPGSPYVGLYVTPSHGLLFEWRTSQNGGAAQIPPLGSFAAGTWLKLERSGSTFTASYSTNGTSWTVVGAQSVTMSAALNVGLAVCGHTTNNTLNTSTFDNVNVSVTSGTSFNPNFPRLGIYAIGDDQLYPSAVWPWLAKFNVVVINGAWEGWPSSIGLSWTREDIVTGIKRVSTIGTKVFQYVNFNESPDPATTNPWFLGFHNLADTNHWWTYLSGTTGAKAQSPFSPSWWLRNMTHNVAKDPSTLLWPYEAAADYAYAQFINPSSANAAPSLDGFFLDNVFWTPRTGGSLGDWNRNGIDDAVTNDNPSLPQDMRTGEKDFFDRLASTMPGKLQMGNNADWGNASTTNVNAVAPLNGVLKGGLLESGLGKSFSVETWGGTTGLMAWYKYLMDTTGSPKLVLFNQTELGYAEHSGTVIVANHGADPYDSTPYRAMRYGLACALMNDGYYDPEGYTHYAKVSEVQEHWYDEFDGGGLGLGYLGQPVAGTNGDVQTGPRWTAKHVWAREFQNGIVIMNPKGSGLQTITPSDLPGNWKRLTGSQAPTVNNGHVFSTSEPISLADRDGIILLKN